MANNNNGGVDNNPDNSKDAGLDKSFVGKFVSGIFNSTPLSKWFGKDLASKSTIRRREDDEDLDTTTVLQPPSKRAKLPTDVEQNSYSGANNFDSPVTVHNASNNVNNVSSKVFRKFPEPMAGPSGIKSRKLFEKHNTASTNTISTDSFENQVDVINGDNDSDSEESTSGYSSAPKLINKEKNVEASNDKSCEKITPKARSLFTSTHDTSGSRSLFTERSPQINTSLSSRRPAFNASTFGSPNFVDRTLSTKRILSSPFYSGQTIYGGASAYGRRLGKGVDDTISLLTRSSVQIKPVNEKPSGENATLSKTARRILSTLEQYSTPISDAKKIPVTPRKPGLLSTYVGATPYLVRDRKKPSNKELQVPSVPDLLQMKQKERLQNSTETVRQIATKSKSSLNTEEYKLRTDSDNKQKHSSKMKSSVASVRHKPQSSEEPVSEVKLPKVSLPITTLPKFDFVLMPPSSTTTTVTAVSDNKSVSESNKSPVMKKPLINPVVKPPIADKKETEKKTPENGKISNYTFSDPLVISSELKPVTAINCFKFSEPLSKEQMIVARVNFKSSENNSKTDCFKTKNNGENVNLTGFTKQSTQSGSGIDVSEKKKEMTSSDENLSKTSQSRWECPTCLEKNDSQNKKCSACDEPKPSAVSEKPENKGFGDQFKLSSNEWECSSCMVRNNNNNTTCVACSTPKPPIKSPVVSGFGDKFKPPAATWECTSCLIRNKNELDSCAACGTTKGGSQKTTTGFGEKFKPPVDTWECPSCMIRNKNDLDKCLSCKTPKPGAKIVQTQKTSSIFGPTEGVKFDQKPMFNFGIQPTQWECKACRIKNNNDLTKCAACQTPKDGSRTTTKGFGDDFKKKADEWECSSCMVMNKSPINTCVCCGVVKPGNSTEKLSEFSKTEEKKPVNSFNFGLDRSSSVQYKFGIPATASETKEINTPSSTSASSIFGSGDATTTVTTTSCITFTFGIKSQEKVMPTNPVTSTSDSAASNVAANPLQTNNEIVVTSGSSGIISNTTESSKPSEFSSGFGSKPAPMFQFKPPAINGDINKPKDTVSLNNFINKSNTAIVGGDLNKSKESIFGVDTKKSQESPFGNHNKSTNSPFGKVNKPADSLFSNPTKIAESPFSNVSKPTELPFGNATKSSDSPFGNSSKTANSPFSNITADINKPKQSLFESPSNVTNAQGVVVFGKGNDTSKSQDTIFGGDANKPKESLFGSKPPESNLFSTQTSKPTFSFNPKPVEPSSAFPPASSSMPAASGIFKFGADSSQTPTPVKTFGEPSESVSNGFGGVQKMQPFVASTQGFGTPENKPFGSADKPFGSTENKPFASSDNKPFAFGSTDSAAKSSSFSFGQADKPNTSTPVFSFGSGAAATAATSSAPNSGFNFSVPSGGFNFGSAASKIENQPFNSPNVFGSAGTGAKNGSFNFGTNANNNNQKAGYTFGSNQSSQPTLPGFPTQSQPSGFNFGAPAPNTNSPGSFNFTGASPSFNFTDGNSGTAPPQRRFKKAVRRTHR